MSSGADYPTKGFVGGVVDEGGVRGVDREVENLRPVEVGRVGEAGQERKVFRQRTRVDVEVLEVSVT